MFDGRHVSPATTRLCATAGVVTFRLKRLTLASLLKKKTGTIYLMKPVFVFAGAFVELESQCSEFVQLALIYYGNWGLVGPLQGVTW